MIYIGIDNGVSGAAAMVGSAGHLVDWYPMPIQRGRQRNEIDVRALFRQADEIMVGMATDITYIIEEPGGSKSASAAMSMAGSFHAVRAVLEWRGKRVLRVTPQQWQRAMLPGAKAKETKPRALALARQLWPDENWLATDRCRTPHDGGIDAALIAEYGRRNQL